MPQYTYQTQPMMPFNGQGANTTNLGYRPPTNGMTGTQVDPAVAYRNETGLNYLNQTAAPQQMAQQGGGQWGGASGGSGGGFSIQDLINKQMTANDQARNQSQALWNKSEAGMQGITGLYNNMASTQGSQRLTNQLLANPEALNDQTMGRIQNQSANGIAAGIQNQMRQQQGILAAGGQNDASTMSAMAERLGRQGMAAQQNASTQLEIQRANQRNADITGAAGLGMRQSAQDIGVPMGVQSTIMQNLPQHRPDDYSGLIALSGQMQQQNQMNQILRGMGGMGDGRDGPTIHSPTAQAPIGGRYRGPQTPGAGFNLTPTPAPYMSQPGFAGPGNPGLSQWNAPLAPNNFLNFPPRFNQQPQMVARQP